jgi:hypothetical protein
MRAATKNCGKYGHAEFSVNADENFPKYLDSFFGWLESEVAVGKRFLPEQTVQMGWSLLKVFQREDGTLGLLEPDFRSMPIKFVDSVSNTLFHMLLQKGAAESLDLDDKLDLPPLRHSAIICTNFGTTTEIFLSRTAFAGSDSGWFFGCAHLGHDHQSSENLRRISLYEAAVRFNEQILPYLGLPIGMEIHAGDTVPRFWLLRKEIQIKPNSYLHKKFGRSS